MPRRPVSIAITSTGAAVVACDDGTCWMWGEAPMHDSATDAERDREAARRMSLRLSGQVGNIPHTWIQFHTPIPGSESWAAYNENRSKGGG